MKTRFNTFDIVCVVAELQKCIGMRVNNVYDINTKTYLIRLQRSEEKQVILLESGNRIHLTNFEWPKNIAPSGFSMKLRKHLRNKRLESLTQLGTDRIVDLQFGTGEAAYHIILELYDRGNIIITDHTFMILNVLRPHTEGDKVKFAVRELYPQDRARESAGVNVEELREALGRAKVGDPLKKVLVSNLEYGPALIEHILLRKGFNNSTKIGKTFDVDKDLDRLVEAINEADEIFKNAKNGHTKGYIIQKSEERPGKELFYTNQEFHPMLFEQHLDAPHKEFPTFNEAIDEFFSSLESQKLEVRAVQQEREAMKKLENVRKDHTQRLEVLELTQNVDKQKADLILRNQELVDGAILAVQSILAKQISWDVANDIVKSISATGDPVFGIIKKLKLETNHITLHLTDPYADNSGNDEGGSGDEDDDRIPAMMVDIDLGLSAFANARKYFDQKRSAAKKQQKTIESHTKALKSAEKKTKQVLKEVQVITNIIKARKTYWFEKFFWFISSENYLVIGGRDQQQNELIVKRYMKSTDVYVHADVHGASSIVIKNPTGQPVPPKTLNEAGTMAICYSVAWEAKVVTNAYWVWGDQVTKTAPTGEYLTTGSFMVRGKKNFLPPSHLILGLGFLFRLEDGSVERHRGERRVLNNDVEEEPREDDAKEEQEVEILDESEEDEDDKNPDETQNDDEKSSDSEDDRETTNFPDTHIKIQHFFGAKMNILTELPEEPPDTNADTREEVIYLGDDKPIVVKPTDSNSRSRGSSESKNKKQREQVEFKEETKQQQQQQQVKRGQKSKLKKIKEKYKDQDEEERKLRMEILQSSGGPKTSKKSKKKKEQTRKIILPKVPKIPANPKDEMGGDDDDEGETVVQADVDMVDALTGMPSGEDELLFAVPVVAPYNTLSNYKFKMKLTPGTGRRGKAARTAVSMFLRDRTITQREKDLLKAVKDEQLARNIPGKVKLSAPKLQSIKK